MVVCQTYLLLLSLLHLHHYAPLPHQETAGLHLYSIQKDEMTQGHYRVFHETTTCSAGKGVNNEKFKLFISNMCSQIANIIFEGNCNCFNALSLSLSLSLSLLLYFFLVLWQRVRQSSQYMTVCIKDSFPKVRTAGTCSLPAVLLPRMYGLLLYIFLAQCLIRHMSSFTSYYSHYRHAETTTHLWSGWEALPSLKSQEYGDTGDTVHPVY